MNLFSRDRYEAASEFLNPDAILVRSASLHGAALSKSVLAIARAGAGVNNIPVDYCSENGIVVFNTPGANANAVKEMVLASLFLASRKIMDSAAWVKSLANEPYADGDFEKLIEKSKSLYGGPEIYGKTLGVVGLGAIGVMVANDALSLGMNVMGYDPYISVDAAWKLSRNVQKAESLEAMLDKSDYVTIHVPYSETTKSLLNYERIHEMKKGARLINFARSGLVDEDGVIHALDRGRLALYVTDFPSYKLLKHEKIICTPHLGASTPEAEINCAVMAAKQLMDFLETGVVRNSVNFPRCTLQEQKNYRLIVVNRNIPNMVGQITTAIASRGVNITDLVNHHQGNYAYNIIDAEQKLPDDVLDNLRKINGIIRVRTIDKK